MNKRRFLRTDFETDGVIQIGVQRIPFTLIDVSLKGALVNPEDPDAIPLGATGTLTIGLPGSPITITASGRCVHREYHYLGFRFESIDAESMTHLRRLLELNTGEGDEITSELSFLVDEE